MGSEFEPFRLKMGVTHAFFQDDGNFPDCKDLLKSLESGLAIISAHIFRSLFGILSGPVDLLVSSPFRILRTSGSVTRTSARLGTGCSGGVIWGIGLSCVSSLLWEAKCLLKIVALSASSVSGVPSCVMSGGIFPLLFLPTRPLRML